MRRPRRQRSMAGIEQAPLYFAETVYGLWQKIYDTAGTALANVTKGRVNALPSPPAPVAPQTATDMITWGQDPSLISQRNAERFIEWARSAMPDAATNGGAERALREAIDKALADFKAWQQEQAARLLKSPLYWATTAGIIIAGVVAIKLAGDFVKSKR